MTLIEKFKQRNLFSTYFFYIIYFLLGIYYLLFSFMSETIPQYWNQVIFFYHALLILLLVKVLLQKNTLLQWIFLVGLLYLCYKSFQYNYDFYNIFGTMMLLCCAKNIEIKKLIKVDFFVRIVRIILFILLPFTGLMANNFNIWIGGRLRTFFGWTHANMMGLDFLLLTMDLMYLRKESKKWYDCVLYAAIIIFLDKTANSRTAEIVIAILIIIQLLSILLKETWFHNIMILFTSGAFALCIGIPLIGSYIYLHTPDVLSQYDGTFLSRIQLTVQVFVKYGRLAFYGFPLETDDCLDMMYSYIGLHWGIAASVIITLAILYAIYRAAKERQTDFLILLFLFLIYGCSEVAHIYPVYSYCSLLFGYYIMNHKPICLSSAFSKMLPSKKYKNGDA